MGLNIMSNSLANLEEVNERQVSTIVKAARRVMDLLVISSDGSVFAGPKGVEDKESFNKNIDAIIVNKIRQKTNI